ncbi:MAG: glycerol-3-phosphate dehydrogenase [Maritimibacter sp.]
MAQTADIGKVSDLFVIGGGVNGCGIARDAAGRGMSVTLAEMNDLASATSSASTKLFHGGLRYLEYFELRLVHEALVEREVLLKAMPHISWPMRFVLPYHPDMRFEVDTPTSKLLGLFMPWLRGRRPAWLIRIGLFMYDHLGGRKILPGTTSLDLHEAPEGAVLQPKFAKAYEYSDCGVEDARLVVLNARDAAARGAEIMTRSKVVKAERVDELWRITVADAESGETREHWAKMLVNAAGPWVEEVIRDKVDLAPKAGVRLVRGSHIVVPKLYEHDKCYFFQGTDGRIAFAIPYEGDFTLIGTTDQEHHAADDRPECTEAEQQYLVDFVNNYLAHPISREDIVWTYSGVRPLYDDGASSATAATRDYVLTVDKQGAPLLNVFGGKITTYRRLAEAALDKIAPFFPGLPGKWTEGVALPGGDFAYDRFDVLVAGLQTDFPFLSHFDAHRLIRAYGTEARVMLAGAKSAEELGEDFGAGLTEREVNWLISKEYAQSADDILWRRSKLGLRLTEEQVGHLAAWVQTNTAQANKQRNTQKTAE